MQHLQIFLTHDASNDTIWRADGTSGSEEVVADLAKAAVEVDQFFGVVASDLYFAGVGQEQGRELWRVELNPTIPGDLDFDGEVGFKDFLMLSSSFGKQFDVSYSDGDIDGDGRVAFSDFLMLAANFGRKS